MPLTEVDTTQEAPSPNGHWRTFSDDEEFVQHIFACKPAEKLVPVPEWEVEILCRALNAENRLEVQLRAYDEKTKKTDFRKVFHLIVLGGCFNPATGNVVFEERHRDLLMRQQDGSPVERLAMTILQLSKMLPDAQESIKKN